MVIHRFGLLKLRALKEWSVIFIELLVVIIGLVLAFQVDRWWEERADRSREWEYIARLNRNSATGEFAVYLATLPDG